ICLIHAAAGGVGQLFCQLARRAGAQVIGTAGGPEKVELAKKAGAHHCIDYRSQDFEAEVKRISEGKGVHVVYDSVGKDTWEKSLRSLRPRGMLVLFGGSSGPVPPFVAQLLDPGALIDAVAAALADISAGRASLPPRIAAVTGAGLLGAMVGYVPSLDALAAKLVSVFPQNRDLPTHQAVIAAFDPRTGAPLALMDGTEITAQR